MYVSRKSSICVLKMLDGDVLISFKERCLLDLYCLGMYLQIKGHLSFFNSFI